MTVAKTLDPFFDLDEDTQWNACIGPQGYDSNYVDGYLEAAILLADEVVKQERYIQRDTLAMPILYNARHAIELLLKHVVRELVQKKIISHAPPANHDIKAYWDLLDQTPLGDEMLTALVDAYEPFVASLAAIDADGQELRYSQNREGIPSLEGRPLVNLQVIRKNLFALKDITDRLKHRLERYVEERVSGTFTPYCSRQDLFTIAGMLPLRNQWGLTEFHEAKSRIRERFDLSNKQFQKALDIIQQHRELGSHIGLQFRLMHLTEDKIGTICEQWTTLHPAKEFSKGLGIDYFERSWENVRDHVQRSASVQAFLLEQLSIADIADLEAIFYIGRERLFSESYETMVTAAERRINLDASGPRDSLHHLINKTNLLSALSRGLQILGCTSLSANIKGARPDLFTQ